MTILFTNQVIIQQGSIVSQTTAPTIQSFAVQYDSSQVDYIKNIKANGTTIYDLDSPVANNGDFFFEIFTGRPGQPKSAIIQQVEGIGGGPDTSGKAFIVFKNFDFVPFGGTIPTITVTFVTGGTNSCSGTVVAVPATNSDRIAIQPNGQPFLYGSQSTAFWKIDTLAKTLDTSVDLSSDGSYISTFGPESNFTFDPTISTKGFFGVSDGRSYEFNTSGLTISGNTGVQSNAVTISNVLNNRFATGTITFGRTTYIDTTNISTPIFNGDIFNNSAGMIALCEVSGITEIYVFDLKNLERIFNINEGLGTFSTQSFDLTSDLAGNGQFMTYDSFTKTLILGDTSKLIQWDPLTQSTINTITTPIAGNNKSAFQRGPFNGKLYLKLVGTADTLELDIFNFTTRTISMPGCLNFTNAMVYDHYSHAIWATTGGTSVEYRPLDRFIGGSTIIDGSTSVIWNV